jgi:DnaK suppressor protein
MCWTLQPAPATRGVSTERTGTLMTADLAIFPPPAAAGRNPAAEARHLHPAALPRWRALLGVRWQERLERVTELSVAYHDAREAAADTGSGQDARVAARRRASQTLHRAVAERLALAEIEAALARLAAGRFGWCEQCGAAITTARLAEIPQARYCPECER